MKAGLVEISWTLVFQIINTIILFLALKKVLFKPVTEFMSSRQNSIAKSIQEAEEKNKQADYIKAQYEEKLRHAEEKGKEIEKEIVKKAEQRADEIVREAQEKAEKRMQKAEAEIQRERAKAINDLKDEMASIALMAAGKVIDKSLDEARHYELIQEFMNEVGDKKWQN